MQSRFAFVDIETTGGSMMHNRIIEIGVLIVENGEVVQTWSQLVNPETSVSSFISDMTGIRTADLEQAPTFFAVHGELLEILEGAIFVAHNARFDYGFIRAEFQRIGVDFKAKTLCSVKLSRKLFPRFKRHNLDEIIARYGLVIENRHRAFDDAKVIWDFFQHLQENFPLDHVEEVLNQTLTGYTSPPLLDEKILQKFPETPGVYTFYGKDGESLYIGKSINLKQRIHSHFQSSLSSDRELQMFQRVSHVETQETAGEFSALILEANLVKEHQPLFNRKLRRLRKLTILEKVEDEHGYLRVEMNYLDEIRVEQMGNILGIFKSQRQAETFLLNLGEEFQLCRRILGLEKGKGECFLYQLKKCSGACLREEIFVAHNMRFLQAFEHSRIKRWPFEGAIVVEEKYPETSRGEIFVVDQWCIIGYGKYEENDIHLQEKPMIFDLDTYKILARHLLKKKLKVRKLPQQQIRELFEKSKY